MILDEIGGGYWTHLKNIGKFVIKGKHKSFLEEEIAGQRWYCGQETVKNLLLKYELSKF